MSTHVCIYIYTYILYYKNTCMTNESHNVVAKIIKYLCTVYASLAGSLLIYVPVQYVLAYYILDSYKYNKPHFVFIFIWTCIKIKFIISELECEYCLLFFFICIHIIHTIYNMFCIQTVLRPTVRLFHRYSMSNWITAATFFSYNFQCNLVQQITQQLPRIITRMKRRHVVALKQNKSGKSGKSTQA